MANPSVSHHQEASTNGNVVPPESPSGTALKHNPGISIDWTFEEQALLDEGLTKYGSESNVNRYAKIAVLLPNKTVRDVALRCRWMTKKENSKRRKEDITRKAKDKKERVTDPPAKSSHLTARPNIPSYAMPSMLPTDNQDVILFRAIGGATGELLEQNAQAFSRISANFAVLQIQENINLLCQTRNNILRIMNDMADMPEMMRQMPPLPVMVNEELANTILPPPSLRMQS